MKVNQISEILNDVYGELIGESALITENLSNIVDVGVTITGDSKFEDNFENYVGKIVDKVGRVVFHDDMYTAQDLGIWKDSWEYASVLEKIRCEVDDYRENKEWELLENGTPRTYSSDDIVDIFSFEPVKSVEAKYWNLKTTFAQKISITKKQMKSAFRSANEMSQFIANIENRIRMKQELAKEALAYRTVVNLIAEKLNSGNNVINLLALYIKETGDTDCNAANCLTNKEFLRYTSRIISTYKSLMSKASMLYNDGGFVNVTSTDRLKALFLTDYAKALETTLYSDTFNNEWVKLDGYKEVPYWQGSGTTGDIDDRSSVNCVPASEGDNTSYTTAATGAIQQNGVLAVLFDDRAAMCCNEDPDVRSQYNARDNFYNYFYTFDCSYFNDTNENVLVFVTADYVYSADMSHKASAPADFATKVDNLYVIGTASDAGAVKWGGIYLKPASSTYNKNLSYFEKVINAD